MTNAVGLETTTRQAARVRFLIAFVIGLMGLALPAVGQAPPLPGLRAYWSMHEGHAGKLGHIDWEIYDETSIIDDINFARTNGAFKVGGPVDRFALRAVGTLTILDTGLWNFILESDQGARLWINGQLIINDGASHSYRSRSGNLALDAGEHDIEVHYYEGWSDAGLVLKWDGPNTGGQEVIPDTAFTHPAAETAYDPGGDGVWAYWYHGTSHTSNVGQIDWTDSDRVEVIARPSFRKTSGALELGGPSDHFASRFIGVIEAHTTGTWTFELGSDQSGALLIDGQVVVADPSSHSFHWRSGTVDLEAGEHTIEVRHVEGWAEAGLMVAWKGPGDAHSSIIPSSAYKPGSGVVNPPSGGGLRVYWSDSTGYTDNVGQVDWAEHDSIGSVQKIYCPKSTGPFRNEGPVDSFSGRYIGQVTIPRTGNWKFNLGSDQSARLAIDGQVIVDDPSSHSFRWKAGTVHLGAGDHDIELWHLEGWAEAGLILTWQGPGDAIEAVIPPSALAPNETDPPLDTGGDGLRAYWASGISHASKAGRMDWMQYDETTIEPNISWPRTTGAFHPDMGTDHFGVRLVGTVTIPEEGEWRFGLGSDQYALLFVDGELLINDESSHSFRWKSGTIELTAGDHEIEVRHVDGWAEAGLIVTWKPPGGVETVIPPSAFSHPAVETPFDSGGGGVRAYYSHNVPASNAGQVDWEVHDHAEVIGNISWKKTTGAFYTDGPADKFGTRILGQVDIPADGSWTFGLGSDQSALLFIDDTPVVVDASSHGYRWRTGTIDLIAGLHEIEVWHQDGWAEAGLHVSWKGPTIPYETIIPGSVLSLQDNQAPFEPGGGLRAYWTTGTSHTTSAAQIAWSEHDTMSVVPKVSWNQTSGAFYTGGPTDHFAVRLVGTIDLPTPGEWKFGIGADQSVIVLIDDEPVVIDTSSHGFRWKKSGAVTLDAGLHSYEIRFVEGWADAGLIATWQPPGYSYETIIPASAFDLHDQDPIVAGEDAPPAIRTRWVSDVHSPDSLEAIDFTAFTKSTREPRLSWRKTRSAFYDDLPHDYFAAQFSGKLIVPSTGDWTFNLGSDQAALLKVDGQAVVSDESSHGFHWRSGTITLGQGEHDLEVIYHDGWSDAGLFLTWRGPDDPYETVIPAGAFVAPTAVRVVRWQEVPTTE